MLNNPITAPPNRQPNTGLLAVAARPDPGGVEWEAGFGFNPESCDPAGLLEITCEATDVGDPKEAGDNPSPQTYTPAVIVAGHKCSTMSGDQGNTARARRHLATTESEALERLLWTGEATNSVLPVGRMHLADSTATAVAAGAAIDFLHGLALVDHLLTVCAHNVQGMIHMAPYALAVFAEKNAVSLVNNRWLSPNGNLIVAGAGYTGQGPRANPSAALPAAPTFDAATPPNQWIYGTSMVNVLLGEPETLDDVDRAVNTRRVIGERTGAAFWDHCCQFAAQLDFTPA